MRNKLLTYPLLCLLCCISACTSVELCPEETHPHVATIQAQFDWGEFEREKPARMNIVASRILNTWRVHGISGTEEEKNAVANGLSAPILMEGEEDPASCPFRMKGGEYKVFAINTHEGLVIDSLECYLNHPEAKVDTLYLHMLETPREKIEELQGLNLPDFNPTYRYIENPGRIFYGLNPNVTIQTGQTEVLHFDIQPVSQKVEVKFSIKKTGSLKDQIKIETVVAEMSGICGRINISSAYLDTTNLYRMVFSFDSSEAKTSGDVSTYSTTFYTMGIVPSPKEGLLVGQGILQIAVKASLPKPQDEAAGGTRAESDEEGNKAGDKEEEKEDVPARLKRFFYAAGNPRQVLLDAQMIERREDGKSYLRYRDEPIVIELGTMLEIDSQEILDQKGENTWEDQDKDDNVDIEM